MRFDIPWTGDVNRLQGEMERLFGDGSGRAMRARAYPPVNLWEDDDNLHIESELPGMELDELELFASADQQLTLQGERVQPGQGEGIRHRQERAFGRFSRIIDLPVAVDAEAASADYKAGVLRITLPKREEAKPKRISVQAS